MELHLFRHGETNWNKERRAQGQSESQLTELGIQQARELGERIKHLQFDQVFCSSSVRTRQTAEQVFAHEDVDIEFMDSLREIHLGPWEGRLYDDIQKQEPDSYRHFWHEPHLFSVPGAETFYQLQDRAMSTVLDIKEKLDKKQVAIVSHGALIKTVLGHVQGRSMEELWTPPHMHNCAHSIVRFDDNGDCHIIQYADVPVSEYGS